VVFLNLLEGVMIGLALAAASVLWRVLRAPIQAHRPAAPPSPWRVTIAGSCSFFALPKLNGVLQSVPAGADVVVELNADYVDHSFREALLAWQLQHQAAGGTVNLEEHGNTVFRDAAHQAPRREEATELPLPPRKEPLLQGVNKYHRRFAHQVRPLVHDLTEGQNPDSLFVGCIDSRVNPNLITSSGPGDLLTLRNIGNVVCGNGQDASTDSALSFAVNGLGVQSVAICGHSNCGAMKALLAEAGGEDNSSLGPAFGQWLDHARPSYTELLAGHPVGRQAAAAGYARVDQLAMVNVAVQLAKLQDHPVTGPALVEGKVQATGLFYDIATAQVLQITATGIRNLDPAGGSGLRINAFAER
jgi:carbonic anhydrase